MKLSTRMAAFAGAIVMAGAALTGCAGSFSPDPDGGTSDFDFGDCTPVIAAVSPEKTNLVAELARLFEESPEAKSLESSAGKCARIQSVDVSSGEAARLLNAGWPTDQTTKPRPTLWSPASSSWVSDVAATSGAALVESPVSFTHTPVVFAMPEQMAKVLGWPDTPISINTLHDLCLDPNGWGSYGGSAKLWGDFKLGKTTPTTSTTGRNVLLMQSYAAAGKTEGLTEEDVDAAASFNEEFESCVIHYGDTTGNVLQRVYDRDAEGRPLDYVSAIAVEETSLINYNLGNPQSKIVTDGTIIGPEGNPVKIAPPSGKLVAIYPEGGSLESDNPIVALGGPNADWVSEEQRTAGQAFIDFLLTDTAQDILDDFGFRPLDNTKPLEGLFTAANGVIPTQPATYLEQPTVDVTTAATQQWAQIRKPSSVLVLIDASGSMGDGTGVSIEGVNNGNQLSRMQLAVYSAKQTLGHFRPTDELGVWVFTSGISSDLGENLVSIRDLAPLTSGTDTLSRELDGLQPLNGTPLYDSVAAAHEYMTDRAEAGRINAIIVLSDGEDSGSFTKIDELTRQLQSDSEGINDKPVRIFPIVFGGADSETLKQLAEASGGQLFDASDPRRLAQVFQSVVNNF